jgi:membrane associated rhomboid family serine protease
LLAERHGAAYVGTRFQGLSVNQPAEPILNVPAVVVATLSAFVAVHVIRVYVLTPDQDLEFLLLFSFIPVRYDGALLLGGALPGGFGAQIWTFVTYAFIHADVTHIGMNTVWFLPFGSAVARRFGAARFLAFFAVTAACGAATHLAAHAGEMAPVIGASAAVSAMMGASVRFAFQPGGPLAGWSHKDDQSYQIPAAPLLSALRDPRILIFLAVWFGLNLLFGLGSLPITGARQTVAWEAHIGGFLAGLLLFSAFDVTARPAGIDGGADRKTETGPP